jgi:hypothetical protein
LLAFTASSLANIIAPAPSQIPEAFPAVTVPFFYCSFSLFINSILEQYKQKVTI